MRHRLAFAALLALSSSVAFAETANPASADPAPITCPGVIHQSASLDPAALGTSEVYAVELLRGKTLITSSTMMVNEGQWTPVTVSREQTYLKSVRAHPASGQDKPALDLIPGVATEGFTLALRTDAAEGVGQAVTYSMALNTIDSIDTVGPQDAPVQVARQHADGPFCGQLHLEPGASQTVALGTQGLVMRVSRLAPTPVASVP